MGSNQRPRPQTANKDAFNYDERLDTYQTVKLSSSKMRNDTFMQSVNEANMRNHTNSVKMLPKKNKSPMAEKKGGFMSSIVGMFKPSKSKKTVANAPNNQHRLSGDEEIKEAPSQNMKGKAQ